MYQNNFIEMDIRSLRELHKKEKRSPYLQKVDKNFYKNLADLVDSFKHKCQDSNELELPRFLAELENLREMIREVYELREKKIVLNVLSYVRTGEDIDYEPLSIEEEEFVKRLLETIQKYRKNTLEKILKGEKDRKVQNKVLEKVTVRILRDLPPIVGVDGRIYGSFREEDIVTLPEPNARALIAQGVAQEVKIKEKFK
ncbi:MAG: hypothetical protein DRN25_01295 [Thermoplasmata archaeon]|nr:MAG: hypothetical protein DRN25_01295 [Thermoplasmata archaeon]